MPSESILEQAHAANPHGCGLVCESFSYKTLDFGAFMRKLATVPETENCIIHFRYATHGPVCRRNCHPFSSNGVWFAHNGILDIEPEDGLTDSETAFRNILMPTIRRHGFASPAMRESANRILGWSRFAFMNKGDVILMGPFAKLGECHYSNLRFLNGR